MDINILLLIAALIVGIVIGWILARGQASGTINELESRVRTAQTAAEGAKRDFTNAQSELAVKESHIKTLNANIGILEEKLRRAEQGDKEVADTIARLQEELRVATADRPAYEAELRQRDAELNELRAQLAKAQLEADELRARIAAAEMERESATLRAQFAADTTEVTEEAQFQATLTEPPQAQVEELEASARAEEAEIKTQAMEAEIRAKAEEAIQAEQAKVAALEARAAELRKEIRELRDGLATLAFAGAELVARYEKRTREYEDQLVRLQAQPIGAAGLVAGGATLAAEMRTDGQLETEEMQSQLAALKAELDALVAGKAELEMQLQARTTELDELRGQCDAIRRDLQTEITSKGELVSLLQRRESDLGELRGQLSALDAELDGVIESSPELVARLAPPATGEEGQTDPSAQPLKILAKFGLVKSLINALATGKSELESQLQARSSELDETKQRFAALQADIGALLTNGQGEAGQTLAMIGEELPEDPQARLTLLKTRIEDLNAANVELRDLRARLGDVEAEVDAWLGAIGVPEGEGQLDLKAKLGLLKTRVAELDQARATLAAQVDAGAAELGDLRARLGDVEAEVDAWLGSIGVPEGEGQLDLKAKLGLLKARFADLDQAKATLAAQVDAEAAELGDLRIRLSDIEARLDDLLGPIEVPEGEAPPDLQAKLELLKARFAELDQARATLAAQVDAGAAELGDLRAQLGDVEAEVDAWLGSIGVPEGEGQLDLKAKLGLLKTRFADLDQAKATLAAQVDAEAAELGDLRARLGEVEADVDAWLRTQVEVPEGEIPADLKGKLTLFKSSFYGLKQAKEGAEARLQEEDARLAKLSEQLAKVQGEVEAAVQAKAELETRLQEKEAELAGLNDQLAAVRGELEATNQAKTDLVAQIDALSSAKADLEVQLSEINKRLRQLEEERQDGGRSVLGTATIAAGAATLGAVATSRGEGEGEAAAQADLAAQLVTKDAEIADLNARLEALKNVLQAREVELGELQAKLAGLPAPEVSVEVPTLAVEAEAPEVDVAGDLRAQLDALQAQLSTVIAERDELRAELEAKAEAPEVDVAGDLRAQLDALQAQLSAVIAERDELRAELEAKAEAPTLAAEVPAEPLTLTRQYVKEAKEAAVRAAAEAGREVKTSECPQDLAMTRGIGSVFEQRLYAAGIGTFWELANLTDDDFKRILELDDRQLLRVDFEAIRNDARRLALETDSVGRVWQGEEPDDFEPLEGIGSVYERKLYEAGICTFEALANATVEQLMAICPPTKLRKPNYADWIAQARIMAQKKQRRA